MTPLKGDEIRLLVLDKSEPAPVYTLVHVSLASAPVFYALSYAWTDQSLFEESEPAQKDHIQLDGRETVVGSNLFAALHALCSHGFSHIPLWVDFLCIDQQNIVERNHQVLRMYSIYGKAALVTVWLGSEIHDSHLAFEFMRIFAKEAKDPHWVRRTIREHTFSREWHAVDHLLHRNWWRRLWIIQEMVAATDVVFVCGQLAVQRDVILRFFEALIAVHATYRAPLLHEEGIELHEDSITLANTYLHPSAWNRRTLLQTIYSTGRSLATDRRDKVYGVMGLARDAVQLVGTPDYSLSIEEVYKQFAVSFAREYRSLEFLSLAGLPVFPRTSSLSLPTWTPDLSHRNYSTINSKIRPAAPTNASRDHPAQAQFSTNFQILTARGIFIDVIDVIDGLGYSIWGAEHGMNNYQLQQTKTRELVYATDLDTLEALAKTLIADIHLQSKPYTGREILSVFMQSCWDSMATQRTESDQLPKGTGGFHDWYQRNSNVLLGGKSLHNLVQSANFDTSFSGDIETAKELYNLNTWTTRRRLVITQKGYIGLGVTSCVPGDLICVLFGCSTPVLLRRFEEHYTFLGEAYLHGIMNGEAIDRLKRGSVTVESFCIW